MIKSELTHSPTLNFNQLISQKIAKGDKIISLGLGEPGFSTPNEIISATSKAMLDGFTRYSHSLGLPELRRSIQNKFREENGINVDINNIAVTFGAKQALLVALQALLNPLDEVINITPCYVSYIPQIRMAEPACIIKNIDLLNEQYSLDINKLKQHLNKKTRVIILNSPHNPTGHMLTQKEINQLVELVGSYEDCFIISDEVYEYLNFSGKKHISIGSFESIKDRVITINSFSKSFAMTGWRIGYMAMPGSISQNVYKILQHTNTNVTTFVQKGACKALEMDREFIKKYNQQLLKSARFIFNELKDTVTNLCMPDGGLFFFLNIAQTGLKSDAFSVNLLEKYNVATNAGVTFGDSWDNYIRVSVAGDYNDIREGIEKLKMFIREQ